jgi:CPA2 family monovalent cation:H+ antiporter-2
MILLKDIILVLFLAIVIILILSKFRIPPVIGFLLTGVIIGPSALQLVKTISEIEILAEIGIILLMFSIGLEFSLDKIKRMYKDFLFFGGLQVITNWMVFSYLLYWYGLVMQSALLGGFILALSSTAIVLKLLQDDDELNSPAGLKMTSILLFQDAILVPAMIFIPFINQLTEAPPLSVIFKILLAFGSVILIYMLSKVILPKIFAFILKVRIPDLLMVAVFVFLFGIALFAHQLGISLAMGAFIVGIAISDSDYAHQINTDILPSRHIFNSIFFISIGMFVNLSFLQIHLTEVLVVTLLLVAVKIVIILLLFIISKNPLNIGFMTAFGLAHIGEFSFILLKIAQDYSILDPEIHQILLSSAILSMFSIPFSLRIGKKISGHERFKKELPAAVEIKPHSNHTIIAGFGVNGQNISRILKLLDIPYLIVDLNPATVKKYKSIGEPIYYANIGRQENMKLIGISKASLLVIAINDMKTARQTVLLARNLNPSIKIIVRVNYLTQVESLYNLGADLVLSQDMETSLIFINHILKFYNMPDHVARIQTNLLRKEHYRFFFKDESQDAWKIAMLNYNEQGNELFFISPHSKHISKKIIGLEPFNYEEMNIIGVIRKTKVLTDLHDLVIENYDTIIFSGNHTKVFEALAWMEENN